MDVVIVMKSGCDLRQYGCHMPVIDFFFFFFEIDYCAPWGTEPHVALLSVYIVHLY